MRSHFSQIRKKSGLKLFIFSFSGSQKVNKQKLMMEKSGDLMVMPIDFSNLFFSAFSGSTSLTSS